MRHFRALKVRARPGRAGWESSFEEVALKYVIPQWVNRVGGYDTEAVELFNKNVGPVAGIIINPDGTASLIEN